MTHRAPCGHEGIPIIGRFVLCPVCDRRSEDDPVTEWERSINEPTKPGLALPRWLLLEDDQDGD